MANESKARVAIACQGGGSHTAFTGGVLQGLLGQLPRDVEVVALSGTSGGAICAALAWEGLLRNDPAMAIGKLGSFWIRQATAGCEWSGVAHATTRRSIDARSTPASSRQRKAAW